MEQAGSTSEPAPVSKPRAYVIRLPGAFMGDYASRGSKYTCFQTIVMAENEAIAWEVACCTDVWQTLPFKCDCAQIFPKDPLQDDAIVPERSS